MFLLTFDEPGGELLNGQMVNACADPDFFVRERGGGFKANGEKTALIFFMFVLGVFSPKRSGDAGRGPTIYEVGGVQMLISIEFDRTCDLPGMGSGPPTPLLPA